jgi:(2Fe-2S) ferredoxin
VPGPALQILVCTNDRGADSERPSCCVRGSLELYRALKDEVRARGLKDEVLVTRTGCLRHCSRGPTAVVWPGNFWHGGVAREDAADLLDAALAGRPLERRPMPPGPWE